MNTKVNVSDVTGVEKDECTGHTILRHEIPEHLTNKCSIQFKQSDEYNDYHNRKIQQHNQGKLCMTSCVLNWVDRSRVMYRFLKNISDILIQVPWVLYYGGLLGYYRNKQLIPWDSDLDIVIPITTKLHEYEDQNTKLILTGDTYPIIAKFYDKLTMVYCDVFFWKDSGNDVLISRDPIGNNKYIKIPKGKFYPIRKAYIKGIEIYTPNDIEYNLSQRYEHYKIPVRKLQGGKFIHNTGR